jgi:hypothetical protein
MRKAMLLLAVFGLAGSLWAADPMLGTWKLNIAKSKFAPTEPAPKEVTAIWRELGADQYECVMTGVRIDGSAISVKATIPAKGGVINVQQPVPIKGQSGIVTIVGPGDWYITFMQDGKQVEVVHSVVSKDGKTARNTAKGVDAKGKPYEALDVYDKQ